MKDFKTLRETITTFITTLNSQIDAGLDEPWLSQFKSLKDQYNTVLASLPAAEAAPAAAAAAGLNLDCFWSCLCNLQSMVSLLTTHRAELVAQSATAAKALASATTALETEQAALAGKIDAAITAKVTAGELVAKDTLTQLCSEKFTAGVTEGETKVRNEIAAAAAKTKTVTDRKAAVQTAGLPLPAEDAVLEGTDEEFAARQAQAATRHAALKPRLTANSPMLARVWASEADFNTFNHLVDELFTASGREPFAGGNALDASPTTAKLGCV